MTKLEKQLLQIQKDNLKYQEKLNEVLKKLEEKVESMIPEVSEIEVRDCWSPKNVADVELSERESVKINWGGTDDLLIYRKDGEIVIEKWCPFQTSPDDFDWDFEDITSFKI